MAAEEEDVFDATHAERWQFLTDQHAKLTRAPVATQHAKREPHRVHLR